MPRPWRSRWQPRHWATEKRKWKDHPSPAGDGGRGDAPRSEFAQPRPTFLAAWLDVRAGGGGHRPGNGKVHVTAFVAAGEEQSQAERGHAEGGSIHVRSRIPNASHRARG